MLAPFRYLVPCSASPWFSPVTFPASIQQRSDLPTRLPATSRALPMSDRHSHGHNANTVDRAQSCCTCALKTNRINTSLCTGGVSPGRNVGKGRPNIASGLVTSPARVWRSDDWASLSKNGSAGSQASVVADVSAARPRGRTRALPW